MSDFIQSARQVIAIEQQAIQALDKSIGDEFVNACNLLLKTKGKVVVSGMGKSGHIGNKIAATLASTGTPAFFMHPGEANHGDLGMLERQDLLIAISNSGETSELLSLLPVVKRLGLPIIAISGNPDSTLAQLSDIHLCIKVDKEACSLGLAPTASTTVTLVLGDALAVALLDARQFTPEDFALSHPGGALGRRLLFKLEDIMHKGDQLPLVDEQQTISNALVEISRKSLGMAGIIDAEGKLVGVFTDGDLRRILDARIDVHNTAISQVMTRNCVTAHQQMLAAEVLNIMENKTINGLFVVDGEHKPIGALNMQDLLKAGVL